MKCDNINCNNEAMGSKRYCSSNCSKPGLIYFISEEFGEFIKIGITHDDVILRLKSIQTGNPRDLLILHSFWSEDARNKEKEIHKLFDDLNVKGEWFLKDKEIMDYITSLKML